MCLLCVHYRTRSDLGSDDGRFLLTWLPISDAELFFSGFRSRFQYRTIVVKQFQTFDTRTQFSLASDFKRFTVYDPTLVHRSVDPTAHLSLLRLRDPDASDRRALAGHLRAGVPSRMVALLQRLQLRYGTFLKNKPFQCA